MRRTIICREGVYYLVVVGFVFLGAILREVNLLLLFGSLLLCPMLLAWRLEHKTMEKLIVRRKKPTHVVAGEVFHVPVELTNPRKRLSSWAIVVEDSIQLVNRHKRRILERPVPALKPKELVRSQTKVLRPAIYYEFVKAGETKKKIYSGCIPRRGRYKFGPITLSTRFPVGFFRTTLQLEDESAASGPSNEIVVYPRWGKLSTTWFSRYHQPDESRQKRRKFRASRVSGEFLGVRKWQSGDIKKWIHWKATAKHNELVVRQYEQQQNQDAVILLDLYQPTVPSVREMEHIELVVSFAATLVNELARRGAASLMLGTIGLFEENETNGANGTEPANNGFPSSKTHFLSGQICTPLIESMMERLAVIEPSPQDQLVDLLLQTFSQTSTSSDMFLVTHRAIQWTESERFESLRNDPRLRIISQRIRVVDVSDPELNEYFAR